MENEIKEKLNLLLAQQIVILKRLEKLEYKVNGGGGRSAPTQSYVNDLNKEALRIIDQIKNW